MTGQPELAPTAIAVPADPSSAAFPMVAALIVPGSDIFLPDVMMNPLRTGLFVTLREMGAAIIEEDRRDGGEAMAGFRVRASELRGVEVPGERAPSMIDEYPILAVAAGFAVGTTVMRGLKELQVKESDRLAATADMLRRNGIAAEFPATIFVVHGGGPPGAGSGGGGSRCGGAGGGEWSRPIDHRIAMAALVLAPRGRKPVDDRRRRHRIADELSGLYRVDA